MCSMRSHHLLVTLIFIELKENAYQPWSINRAGFNGLNTRQKISHMSFKAFLHPNLHLNRKKSFFEKSIISKINVFLGVWLGRSPPPSPHP